MLRKVSSAPRDLKLVVGLLERFSREPLVVKTWCAFATKHQKYHRICWKKTFHNFIDISVKNSCSQQSSCASSLYGWDFWKDHSKSTSHNFQLHWTTWDFAQHIIFLWKKHENCPKCCENNQKQFSRKTSFVLSISAIVWCQNTEHIHLPWVSNYFPRGFTCPTNPPETTEGGK